MMPGQVVMMPYDSVSPGWSEYSFKASTAAFSLVVVNSGKDPANFLFLDYGQSPQAGGPGYSPSSLNVYLPTSPYVPQSPFGGTTSLFGTS